VTSSSSSTEQQQRQQLMARLTIGGLRTMCGEMEEILTQIEKTGSAPDEFLESLSMLSQAIELTKSTLLDIRTPCCEFDKKENNAVQSEIAVVEEQQQQQQELALAPTTIPSSTTASTKRKKKTAVKRRTMAPTALLGAKRRLRLL
jgi:hypothetical protein